MDTLPGQSNGREVANDVIAKHIGTVLDSLSCCF